MASKTRVGHANNTYLSKGVIAATGWGSPEDSPQIHLEDTLKGGCYLNDPARVMQVASGIHEQTALLLEWGVPFQLNENGRPDTFKVPGHSHARHVHCSSWQGRDLVLPLKLKAKQCGVDFLDTVLIYRLLLSRGRVCGAVGISSDNRLITIAAKSVVLATGGFAQVFFKHK